MCEGVFRTDDSNGQGKIGYPCLVVRHFAGFYSHNRYRFVAEERDIPENSNMTVVCTRPYSDGDLTNECKAILLQHALKHSAKSRQLMCINFSKTERIFVEPDGKMGTDYSPGLHRQSLLNKPKQQPSCPPQSEAQPAHQIEAENPRPKLPVGSCLLSGPHNWEEETDMRERLQDQLKPMIETDSENN